MKSTESVAVLKVLEKASSSPKKIESNVKCYKIISIPGKGMGVVAQRAIKRGELIMKEEPILRLNSKTVNNNQFNKLPKSQLDELLQLFHDGFANSYGLIDKMKIFSKIWKIYSFDLKSDKHPLDSGVFRDISRINHSCIPNAERNFMDPEMRIYAVQDIKKDAEIYIEYNGIETYKEPTIQLVKSELQSHWNFDCKCELCGATDNKSQKLLENNRIKYWKLCRIADSENDKEKLANTCETIIKQMNAAKYWSETDKLRYSSKGLNAALEILNMPLKEKKRKIRYFFPIIEEALKATQGVDGPDTEDKQNLEKLRFMCETVILPMDEKEYRFFKSFSSSYMGTKSC